MAAAHRPDDLEAGKRQPAQPKKTPKFHVGMLYSGAPVLDRIVLAVALVAAAIHGGASPLFVVIMAEGLHATNLPKDEVSTAIWPIAQMMGAIATASLLAGFIWSTALFWFASRQTARLRMRYFDCVLTRDLAWFDENQAAALPARMVTETRAIHEALGTRTGEIVLYCSQLVVALVVAFSRGWQLTLVICCVIPLILGVGHLMTLKVKAASSDSEGWLAKAGAVTEESLLAVRTVAAFGAEQREVRRLEGELNRSRRGGLATCLATGLSFGFIFLFLSCSFALALWYGSHQMIAHNGRAQVDVIVVVMVVVIGVSSVSSLEGPASMFAKAIVAGASLFGVLGAAALIEPEVDEGSKEVQLAAASSGSSSSSTSASTASSAASAAPLACSTLSETSASSGSCSESPAAPMVKTIESIEFRDVHFSYPSRPEVPILSGLSLRIDQGQKVALVGASGSGKSTVVQLLERFYDPISGGVFINGVALQRLPVRRWRRFIGYVGQEPVLYQASVIDNIKGGDLAITDEDALEAAKLAEAFDFVSSLPAGFQTFVGVGGGQMSGGQKQRIAIARSLAFKPQVLVLDEATSALDNESERLVQATLDQLQSSACTGLTTISVAHRLSTVRNSDAIFVLKHGRVEERGAHADLLAARGEYFSLVEAQRTALEARGESEGDGEQADAPELPLLGEEPEAAVLLQDLAAEPPNSPTSARGLPMTSQVLSSASSPAVTHRPTGEPASEVVAAVLDRRCLRRLLGLSRSEWGLYPLGFISTFLTGGYLPLQGLLLARGFTSLYIQPVDTMLGTVDQLSLAFVALGVATLVGEIGKHTIFGYIQHSLTIRLRSMAFGSMIRQEMGFFDDPNVSVQGASGWMARTAYDISIMTGIGIGNSMQAIFGIIAGITLSFLGSVKLTLVVIALLPLVLASTIIVSIVLTDPYDSEANAAADGLTSAAVLTIRTVRAFVAEKAFQRQFAQAVEAMTRTETRLAAKKGLALAVNSVMVFLVYLIGLWYGGQLITTEGLDSDRVYQALICVTLGFSGAHLAGGYGPVLTHGRRSAASLFSIIDRQPRISAQAPADAHRDMGDGSIEFRDVTFRFPHRAEQRVLKALSFKVQEGQTIALVGHSGGGKSTVIQLLLRYYDPTRGAVRVGGTDLRCFDLAWWRRQVGLVGQEPVLFDVSLEDNIKYGYPEATREEVEAAAREANMDYVFDGSVGWEDHLGIRGERLSGGQKQRCAIARAVVRRPRLLLLDEATSALDSASEQVVQVALDNVRKGRTTFAIAHRLSTIKDSDQILVVSSGELVERGTHEELIAAGGWYAQMAPR